MKRQQLKSSQRLMLGLIAVLLLLAAYNLTWSVLHSTRLLARDDNPRLVFASQRIQRGEILDRNRVPIATTTFSNGLFFREYPIAGTAAITGYSSFNYGTSGLENTFDTLLTSADLQDEQTLLWQREVLYQPQVGRAIRTTIDAELQAALAETAISSGLVVDRMSGDLLAIVSNPSYDANTLDQDWEQITADDQGALVNRSMQMAYPAGEMLDLLLELNRINLTKDGSFLPSKAQFLNFLGELGVFRVQTLEVEHASAHIEPMQAELERMDLVAWHGQSIKLTPLQIVTIMRTVSNQGVRRDVRLILETQADTVNEWVPYRFEPNELVVLPRSVVNTFRERYLANEGTSVIQVSVESVVEGQQITWVSGETQNRELIWIVVEETEQSTNIAAAIAVIEAFSSKK